MFQWGHLKSELKPDAFENEFVITQYWHLLTQIFSTKTTYTVLKYEFFSLQRIKVSSKDCSSTTTLTRREERVTEKSKHSKITCLMVDQEALKKNKKKDMVGLCPNHSMLAPANTIRRSKKK